jgi:hypothetical protein
VNGWLVAAATVALVPTGMAIDHWAVQLRAQMRLLWELCLLWARFVTGPVPLVGPLLAEHKGAHRGRNGQLRKEFREARALRDGDAHRHAAPAESEVDPDKTQPFKPYVIHGGRVAS